MPFAAKNSITLFVTDLPIPDAAENSPMVVCSAIPTTALARSEVCTGSSRVPGYLSSKKQKPGRPCKPVADWHDFTVLFCMSLVVLGAISLSFASQTFSIVKGRVVEKGVGVIESGGKAVVTNTISVFIENDDRVFNIKRGTVVKYPVSEQDVQAVEIGSEVELFVSSVRATVRLLGQPSHGTV